jgi:hypothetical protein
MAGAIEEYNCMVISRSESIQVRPAQLILCTCKAFFNDPFDIATTVAIITVVEAVSLPAPVAYTATTAREGGIMWKE